MGIATLSGSLYDLDPSMLPPAAAGTASAVFVDLFSDLGDLTLTRNGTIDTRWPMSRSNHSRPVTIMAGDTITAARADPTDQVILGGWSAHDLPAAGAYYVFLAGDPAHHLAAVDGIRLIPGVVGQHARTSRELFTLVNLTNAAIQVCRGTTSLVDVLNTGTMTFLLPGFDAMGGLTIEVVLEADGCTGGPNRYSAMLASTRPGRLLVVAQGDTSSHANWNVTSLLEPDPPTDPMTTRQTITFLDATPTDATFTGIAMMAPVFAGVSTTSGMSGFARATAIPFRIDVVFSGGMPQPITFTNWMPTSFSAWAILTGGTGTASQLYAVDSPFGHGWSNDGYLDSELSACIPYCNAIQANCTGANTQYVDLTTCLASCNEFGWPPGMSGATMGDTLACRTTHAMNAATTGATECPIAGPLGGATCGLRCGAFCAEVMSTCSGSEPYATLMDCDNACVTWVDHMTANGPVMITANTLGCRTAVLEAAAGDTTNCADLAATSSVCH
jgi:hypothetical protein